MSTNKRGDQLGKDLGSFFKAAVTALEDASEQVKRSSLAGKASLDAQLLKRQRTKALARLGEIMFDEHARGVSLPPAADDVMKELLTLEADLHKAQAEADRLWKTEGGQGPAPSVTSNGKDDDDDDDDDRS
jgi:hypothetical protein